MWRGVPQFVANTMFGSIWAANKVGTHWEQGGHGMRGIWLSKTNLENEGERGKEHPLNCWMYELLSPAYSYMLIELPWNHGSTDLQPLQQIQVWNAHNVESGTGAGLTWQNVGG